MPSLKKLAANLLLLVLSTIIIPKVESDCRKTFAYHAKYNYGYDIFCNHSSSLELSTTMANNAIFLTIVNSNITFDHSTLRYLRKIRQLNITNSRIEFTKPNTTSTEKSNITTNNPSGFNFNALTNLETLIIQHSSINGENLQLSGLENLVTLKLDNNTFKNVANFQDNHLALNKLQTLSLANNGIKNIGDIPICNLLANNLRNLHMDNNLITNVENQDIKCLKQLEVLTLSGNNLTKLDLHLKNLNNLNVSGNQINLIQNMDTTNLKTLDLSSNKLENIKVSDFKDLKSLKTLNLSKNNLTSVNLPNKLIISLDLSNNQLKYVPTLELPEIKTLNLSYNHISVVNSTNLPIYSLETFEITNNNLSTIGCQTFTNMTKLSVVNLSHNNLKNISLSFLKNNTVTNINLSHNEVETISEELFTNLTKLKQLYVSYNKIKFLNDSTFKPLENLEVLNMSNNLLTQLDYKLLEPLENLIILDVDNNMIQELDYGSIVSELPNLDQFKAKNNLLTCEFLTKMIHYFKENSIMFSLNEHLDYDKENVEGIYCVETRNKLLDLRKTEETLLNNTKMLNALYEKYTHDPDTTSYTITGGEIIASLLSLISLVVLLTLAVQRLMLWHRRRNYLVDELELITKQPYKRIG